MLELCHIPVRWGQVAISLVACVAAGCTFELPELQETSDAVTDDDDDTEGGSGGEAGDGPDNGGGSGPLCQAGEVTCPDGSCADADAGCTLPCDPTQCPQLDHAEVGCGALGCELTACHAGFVDCDGIADNGCEQDFNGQAGQQLVAHQLTSGGALDWTGFPQYAIAEPCLWCDYDDDALLELVPPEGSTPGPDDLQAVFNLGWTATQGFFVRLRVHDDSLVIGAGDPRTHDALELIYHGPPGETTGADDQHVFVDYSGAAASETRTADQLRHVKRVGSVPEPSPARCVELTLQLDGNFLAGTETVDQKLIPAAGETYVFNLGVNDVDLVALGDGGTGTAERQHLVFYKEPGKQYWFSGGGPGDTGKSANVGTVLLAGPPEAAQ